MYILLDINNKMFIIEKMGRRHQRDVSAYVEEISLDILNKPIPGRDWTSDKLFCNRRLDRLRKAGKGWVSPKGDTLIGMLRSRLRAMEEAASRWERYQWNLRNPKPWNVCGGGAWGGNGTKKFVPAPKFPVGYSPTKAEEAKIVTNGWGPALTNENEIHEFQTNSKSTIIMPQESMKCAKPVAVPEQKFAKTYADAVRKLSQNSPPPTLPKSPDFVAKNAKAIPTPILAPLFDEAEWVVTVPYEFPADGIAKMWSHYDGCLEQVSEIPTPNAVVMAIKNCHQLRSRLSAIHSLNLTKFNELADHDVIAEAIAMNLSTKLKSMPTFEYQTVDEGMFVDIDINNIFVEESEIESMTSSMFEATMFGPSAFIPRSASPIAAGRIDSILSLDLELEVARSDSPFKKFPRQLRSSTASTPDRPSTARDRQQQQQQPPLSPTDVVPRRRSARIAGAQAGRSPSVSTVSSGGRSTPSPVPSTSSRTTPRMDADRRSDRRRRSDTRDRVDQTRQDQRRSSGALDPCNHPRNVGCFSQNSGHAPPPPFSEEMGDFGENVCPHEHCKAWLLKSETSRFCCADGSIDVSGDFPPYQSNNLNNDPYMYVFENHPRKIYLYNRLLSMACPTFNYDEPDGQTCILNGMITNRMADLTPTPDRAMFNQLYFLQPQVAAEHRTRMDIYKNNRDLDDDLLQELDAWLREHNVLAQSFAMAYELWERERANAPQQRLPVFTMVLLDRREAQAQPRPPQIRHPHQIVGNIPNEVCAVFRNPADDQEVPNLPKGIKMYIRDFSRVHQLPYWSPNMPALEYPLLLPRGNQTFRSGLQVVRPRKSARRKIANGQYVNDEVVEDPAQDDDVSSIHSAQQDVEDDDADAPEDDGQPRQQQQQPDGRPPPRRKGPSKFMSRREYWRFPIQIRKDPREIDWSFPIWAATLLGQNFLIHMVWTIEFFESVQHKKRQGNMRNIVAPEYAQYLERGLQPGQRLGGIFFTGTSYQGSRRHMQRGFNDGVAIAREYGTPTFFLTVTTNPNWPAIKSNLGPDIKYQDRPDLVCRCFRCVRREIWKDVEKRGKLGPVIAHCESMEFQERGGPHIHKLLILDKNAVDTTTPAFVDEYITAEMVTDDDRRYDNATKQRLRALYPSLIHICSPRCIDQRTNKCKYGYPQPYSNETILFSDRKPIYKRRSPADGGASITIGRNVYDNSRLVPHNIDMLLKYECHLNLEYVGGDEIFLMFYIYQYLFKGTEQAYVQVTEEMARIHGGIPGTLNFDEYAHVFACRHMGPFEGFMRLYEEPFIHQSHTVASYSVHLPDRRGVIFEENEDSEAQIAEKFEKKSAFEAYFAKCAVDSEAAKHTFLEIGKHYRFEKGEWIKRVRIQRGLRVITRLYPVSPRDAERFSLRLLASNINGECAYRKKNATINAYLNGLDDRGQEHNFRTFLEAAQFHGLLDSDYIWQQTLAEAASHLPHLQFIRFFAYLLLFGEPSDPRALFEAHLQRMSGGPSIRNLNQNRQHQIRQIVLRRLSRIFRVEQRMNSDFNIPNPDDFDMNDDIAYHFPADIGVVEEADPDEDNRSSQLRMETMNDDQKNAIQMFSQAFIDRAQRPNNFNRKHLFELLGSGGSGKSYTIDTIVTMCDEQKANCIVTATTGIAATVIKRGRTAHSAFGIPISSAAPVWGPSYQTAKGAEIGEADLIVIDEISMLHKKDLAHIDRVCKDQARTAQQRSMPFGGKVVIICGDWKQLLPVVPKGRPANQAEACIRNSPDYNKFQRIRLRQNMRMTADQNDYIGWTNEIGCGRNFIDRPANASNNQDGVTGHVSIPDGLMVDTIEELMQAVFDCDLENGEEMAKRTIISPVNSTIDRINERILEQLPGQSTVYPSIDQLDRDFAEGLDQAALHRFQTETLNRITHGSLPHHLLELKVGCLVMLLRNMDVRQKLANGTILLVVRLSEHVIYGRRVDKDGHVTNQLIGIARCVNRYDDTEVRTNTALKFKRTQFPLKLCFATTINKGQGRTIERLGMDLTTEVFMPGHLFVGLTRIRESQNLIIYNGKPRQEDGSGVVRNVVWKFPDEERATGNDTTTPFNPPPRPRPQMLPPPIPSTTRTTRTTDQGTSRQTTSTDRRSTTSTDRRSSSRQPEPSTSQQGQQQPLPERLTFHDVNIQGSGDGDCMFRAVVFALNGQQRRYADMQAQGRQQIGLRHATIREMQVRLFMVDNDQLANYQYEIEWDQPDIQRIVGQPYNAAEITQQGIDVVRELFTRYMKHMFEPARGDPTRWAALFEQRFMATAIQRPIVTVNNLRRPQMRIANAGDLVPVINIINAGDPALQREGGFVYDVDGQPLLRAANAGELIPVYDARWERVQETIPGEFSANIILPNYQQDQYVAHFRTIQDLYRELFDRRIFDPVLIRRGVDHYTPIFLDSNNVTPPENALILQTLENVPGNLRTVQQLNGIRIEFGIDQPEEQQHEVAHQQLSQQLSIMSVDQRGEQTPEGSEASSDAFETESNASSQGSEGSKRRRRKGLASAATKARQQKARNLRKGSASQSSTPQQTQFQDREGFKVVDLRMYLPSQKTSSKGPVPACSACHGVITTRHTMTTLGCSHQFHRQCAIDKLKLAKRCPLCNQEILDPSGTI